MQVKKSTDFDYQNFEQEALKGMYAGQCAWSFVKRLVKAGLQGELQAHLEEEKESGSKNHRNGKTAKTVRSRFAELQKDYKAQSIRIPFKKSKKNPLNETQKVTNKKMSSIRVKVEDS